MKKGIFLKKDFKKEFFLIVLFSFVVAYLVNSLVIYLLPKTTVEYVDYSPKQEFFIVRLSEKLCNQTQKVQKDRNEDLPQEDFSEIKTLKLKAVFLEEDSGFIVVEDNKKEVFISLKDVYKGFKLVKILPQSAIFKKGSKKYILKLQDLKKSDIFLKTPKFQKKKDGDYRISKSELRSYRKKYDKLYREIALMPVKTKSGYGYKITYLKKGSVLEKLGLKKGDVILQINSRSVEDSGLFNDLLENFENLEYIFITLLRDHKEKELYYEIY